MTCRGLCSRQEFACNQKKGYRDGNQRCITCDRVVKMEGLWCQCCGYRLRSKPRKLSFKQEWRKRNGLDPLPVDAINRKQIISNPDGTFTVVEV